MHVDMQVLPSLCQKDVSGNVEQPAVKLAVGCHKWLIFVVSWNTFDVRVGAPYLLQLLNILSRRFHYHQLDGLEFQEVPNLKHLSVLGFIKQRGHSVSVVRDEYHQLLRMQSGQRFTDWHGTAIQFPSDLIDVETLTRT